MISDNIIERKFYHLFIIWFIILDMYVIYTYMMEIKIISQRKLIDIHAYNIHSDSRLKNTWYSKSISEIHIHVIIDNKMIPYVKIKRKI